MKTNGIKKIWVELPERIVRRLDRIANKQGRSRQKLLGIIITDAAVSLDAATVLEKK